MNLVTIIYFFTCTQVFGIYLSLSFQIVLHVGVSHKAESLTIERYACTNGYKRFDILERCPDETDIVYKVLETGINVEELCDNVNKSFERIGCKACLSSDAGRYLCEYIFYQSLSIDPRKTLFVHVPDFDKYSSVQTANGLYDILYYLLRNLKSS